MTTYSLSSPYLITLNLATGDQLTLTRQASVFQSGGAAAIIGAGANTLALDGYVTDTKAGAYGIQLNGGGDTVGVGVNGILFGEGSGLRIAGSGNTVVSSGDIGGGSRGLDITGGGNALTFSATSFTHGRGDFSRAVSIDSGGTTLANSGRIDGYQSIVINGGGNVINNVGSITAQTVAVNIQSGPGNTINNAGLIAGAEGAAISANSAVDITNSGTLSGVRAVSAFSVLANSLTNSGYVIGTGDTAYSVLNDGAGDTVMNNGFMQGAGGVCVFLNGGNDFFDGRNGIQIGAVQGGDGNDALFGGASNDYLYGGNNDDQLSGGGSGDVLDGGAGTDFARYDMGGAVTASLAAPASNTGDAAGDTYVSIEGLIGSNAGDLLFGDAAANTLFGLGGADGIAGGDGNDTIYGGDGADNIAGQAGSDVIYGGAGGDVLAGGAGADVFAYSSLAEAGDYIADFNAGGTRDSFDIRSIFDATGYTGTTPRVGNILQVFQNGADTDVYLYSTFLFRIPGLYAPALDDTYFVFQ